MAGKEEIARILVVGGGLAGLSLASTYAESVIFESREGLGGFFIRDELKVGKYSGRELVERILSNVRALTGETVFEVDQRGVWSVGRKGASYNEGIPVLATGFRERTLPELGIYGYRPAGVYPLTVAWDFINMGYSIGDRVVINGFNHYSLALISKMSKYSERIFVLYDKPSYVHTPEEAQEYGAEAIKGRVVRIEGRNRVEKVRTTNGDIRADAVVLAELAPFKLFDAEYVVGNAGMIIEDPAKVAESAKLLALSIIEGGIFGKIVGDVPAVPKTFSLKHPYVVLGVPAGAKFEIKGKVFTAEEPYPVVELPAEKNVTVRMV